MGGEGRRGGEGGDDVPPLLIISGYATGAEHFGRLIRQPV